MKRAAFLLFLMTLAGPLAAQTIPLAEYRARLAAIQTQLAHGEIEAAKTDASTLLVCRVQWNRETLVPDRALLRAITSSKNGSALMQERRDLSALLLALQHETDSMRSASGDKALLDRLAGAEKAAQLKAGGEVPALPPPDEKMAELIGNRLERAWEWIAKKLARLVEWIYDLWPSESEDEAQSFLGMPLTVAILVGAIVLLLLILAFEVWRRRGKVNALPPLASVEASRHDEDPLSREANEWERYADELAAAGRIREAIRAWYNAVLVALYRSGTLHYRKGRTNWEYVSALQPNIPWRTRFVTMTRTFEREWYGRERSNTEALELCAREARQILNAVGARTS